MRASSTLLVVLLLAAILTSPLAAGTGISTQEPMSYARDTGGQLDVVKTFLEPRSVDGAAKVWVFFTDKAVFDKSEFDRKAAAVTFTDHTAWRRSKMGIDGATFGDLPVPREYIDEVIGLGGELRRVSKWLNAASFSVSLDRLDAIAELSFVAKIRPVATFVRQPVETSGGDLKTIFDTPAGDAAFLNYGPSQGQLEQINVPAVHDKGHNGAGVIVAMFDTGYRKDHQAFADAYATGRVLAEWDFIFNDGNTQNEAEDNSDQHRHGTLTWSTLGGSVSGQLYGPAYGASFILAKTEDIRSETSVEEDNWVAAVEWADSIGAEVISSSLSYSDWYTYSDFDGETAITTLAANQAAAYGIVVANSMGNSGPGSGTLGAPADAFETISVGAVGSDGTIASFSSRGPTADGRIKPEICAQGVSTYCASPTSTSSYTTANGTSLSCPLAAGCAAVIISVHPEFTPELVRLAMIETASQAASPDNTYGWGVIDLDAAIHWGARIGADTRVGHVPFTVNFYDNSAMETSSWDWTFGDGGTSQTETPSHSYTEVGFYDVTMQVATPVGNLNAVENDYIVALADTLFYDSDTVYAGQSTVIDVTLRNTQDLNSLVVPITYSGGMPLTLDSVTTNGTRTADFAMSLVASSTDGKQRAYLLNNSPTPLAPGSGPVMRFYFTTDPYAFGGSASPIDSVTISSRSLLMSSSAVDYVPITHTGAVVLFDVSRGDANNDGIINVGDAVFLINYVFKEGPAPVTHEAGDANLDFQINVGDAIYLINFIFKDGPPPFDT